VTTDTLKIVILKRMNMNAACSLSERLFARVAFARASMISAGVLLSAVTILSPVGARAQQAGSAPMTTNSTMTQPNSWWERYEARVTATQSEQPHWVTPLVTVTPRLEQEVRTDFLHYYNTKGKVLWNYGGGKGLELIPEKHTEIIVNVPPFIDRSNGESDGFGDISFLLKERLYSRNEEHGNAIATFFVGASVPTGKNGNGSCCAVVTPTLALGKGFGQFAFTTTAGGTLPVTNATGLGHTITWNNTVQYRLAKTGLGRFFWPEVESNDIFYKGGSNDGKVVSYITPGLVIGRIPLFAHATSPAGKRTGLTFGVGEQISVTHFNTYNHETVITARIPF
jgi:hypothetical protein